MVKTKIEEIFELEKRRKIFKFVSKNPGVHLRGISRKLDIPKTTLKYHLNYLKRKNLLLSKTNGKFTRYYAQYEIGSIDKEILALLRQKIPRGIMVITFLFDEIYIDELSNGLDAPVSTIAYHLKKLKDIGIIDSRKENGRAAYFIKNRHYLYNFFIRYKDNLSDDSSLSALLIYMKNSIIGKNSIENSHKKDKNLDKTIDLIDKLFPLPFCA